jgi:hypothetical protein
MLEIKQPGTRHSAYWDGIGGTVKQGQFVKMNGFATADLGPAGQAGAAKYAASGDAIVSLASGLDTVSKNVFPVKKYHFKPETSDLTLDPLNSGEFLVYYQGGEYETDIYGTISTNPPYGAWLFLDANGKLTTTTGSAVVAEFIQKASTYDSSYTAAAMLWFRLLEFPVHLTGLQLPN